MESLVPWNSCERLPTRDEFILNDVIHCCGSWEAFVRDNASGYPSYAVLTENLFHWRTAMATVLADGGLDAHHLLVPTEETIMVRMPHHADAMIPEAQLGQFVHAGSSVMVCGCGSNHIKYISVIPLSQRLGISRANLGGN